jgi:hypothetical protein
MTAIGSDYFPKIASGRVLGVLLALCAIALCGYLTATLATFFVRQDASERSSRTSRSKINSSSGSRNYIKSVSIGIVNSSSLLTVDC